jgi:pyruvate,water dikinase
MEALEIPDEMPKFAPDDRVLPVPRGYYVSYDLMEAFDTLVHMMFKAWQYHFEYLI